MTIAIIQLAICNLQFALCKNPVFQAVIAEPDAATARQVAEWKNEGFHGVVLVLDERFDPNIYRNAAKAIAANSLDVYYWIEIGRNPTFAREHPEWMASFGSHDDWRKRFPDAPPLANGDVAKVWPWTPIAYKDAFDAHLARARALLQRVPDDYRGLLLNDLQGAPSACGCGNLQCRWAIDYKVPATAAEISGPDVAARFLADIRKLSPDKQVIPVWTTECERHDLARDKQRNGGWSTGYCGEVECFNHQCTTVFNEQWNALHASHRGPTAVLALHREFRRDGTEYGPPANWIAHVVGYLDQQKPQARAHRQLWLVVQGYGVTPHEQRAARDLALRTGVGAVLVARTRIDQSFEPRIIKINP